MSATLPILCVLLLSLPALSADTASVDREGSMILAAADRLRVREAQLALSNAHVARLEAEAAVRDATDQLSQLLQSLRTQYACPDCELKNDLTWVPKPKADAPKPIPAPEKARGQTPEKGVAP